MKTYAGWMRLWRGGWFVGPLLYGSMMLAQDCYLWSPILDQIWHDYPQIEVGISSESWVGQSWTVGLEGYLACVSVDRVHSSVPIQDVPLEYALYTQEYGWFRKLLAEGEVEGRLGPEPKDVLIDFRCLNLAVSPGDELAIVLKVSAPTNGPAYYWLRTRHDYPGGFQVYYTPDSYYEDNSGDFDFRTWVEVDLSIPVAVAGKDQIVHAGVPVLLNGSRSYDNETPSGELLYRWRVIESSGAYELLDEDTAYAQYTPLEPGCAILELVVVDADANVSDPAHIEICAENVQPYAIIYPDYDYVPVGRLVELDGSLSEDDDGDVLLPYWQGLNFDLGLPDPNVWSISFAPQTPGWYGIVLYVSDSWDWHSADANVFAVSVQVYLSELFEALLRSLDRAQPEDFRARGHQRALLAQATALLRHTEKGTDLRELSSMLVQVQRHADAWIVNPSQRNFIDQLLDDAAQTLRDAPDAP